MAKNNTYMGCALRIAIGITMLILTIIITAVFVIAGQAATITVCPGGCDNSSIQAAINAANPEDTIEVHSGTYYENTNVNKKLTLLGIDTGSGKPIVDAQGNGHAITLSTDGIILEGFTVTNATTNYKVGILLASNNNTVSNNTANNNYEGMEIRFSNNNTLTDNNVSQNYIGIWLDDSNYNTLKKNNFNCNNEYGIYTYGSTYNIFTNNNFSNNNNYGIEMDFSNNNEFTNNNFTYNSRGTSVYYSDDNIFKNNNISNNNYYGIRLYSGNNNTIINNKISNNIIFGGIRLDSSSNNTISNNSASHNNDGIYLISSGNNTLTNNNDISNNTFGIRMSSSSNNTLSGNIASNNQYGIGLSDSNNNTIYNNFLNNFNNFVSTNSVTNWNTTRITGSNVIGGPYIGGNFWTNPEASGFSQTCTDDNHNGLCDSSYMLDDLNADYFALAATPPGYAYITGTALNNSKEISYAIVATITSFSITDASGFYYLQIPAGNYNLIVTGEPVYYPNSSVMITAIPGTNVVQDIELLMKPTGIINGLVNQV